MTRSTRSRDAQQRNKSSSSITHRHKYTAVSALILYWKDNDLNIHVEADALSNVLTEYYGYHVEAALLPTDDPDGWLETTLTQFIKSWDSKDTLLIVYYGGHGSLNETRGLHWHCTNTDDSPEVAWYAHQRHLEHAISDVLLLLDCCHACGTSGRVTPRTTKEVISASSFGHTAPGVGPHSFTHALITELLASYQEATSGVGLYNGILRRLRSEPPVGQIEQRQSPQWYMLGENRSQQSTIEIRSYITFPTNLIAVMGATGSGKSSFINAACGNQRLAVGHNQTSETSDIELSVATTKDRSVTFVDTPGFDDTNLSETDILRRISSFLHEKYEQNQKLRGIVYLRSIHQPRMEGSCRRNLSIFMELCGEEYLQNVVFVTTKWDQFKDADLNRLYEREMDLKQNFLGRMLDAGCDYKRYFQDNGDEEKIIAPMIQFKPEWTQIQEELAKHCKLENTTAGKSIVQKVDKTISASEVRLAELQAALETAPHPISKDILLEDEKEYIDVNNQAKRDKHGLQSTPSELVEEESKRRWKRLKAKFDQWLEDMDCNSPRSPQENLRAKKVRRWSTGIYVSVSAFIVFLVALGSDP